MDRSCNCYGGIDHMINEGGRVYPSIGSEELQSKLGKPEAEEKKASYIKKESDQSGIYS